MDSLGIMRDELLESDPEKNARVVDILHASHHGLISSKVSSEQIAALLGITYEAYRERVRDGESRNEILLEYILGLRKNYKTAMLSNIASGSIYKRFTKEELIKYFDVVVTSGDEGFAKPEAQIYEITADRLEVRLDECIFTDDNETYCDAAKGLGMQAILYKSFDQFKIELGDLLGR